VGSALLTSGRSALWGSLGMAGRVRFFGSGTNAEKDRSSGNWQYTVAAGKAKWRSRLIAEDKGDQCRRNRRGDPQLRGRAQDGTESLGFFRPQILCQPCNSLQERYNLGETDPKKEIPVFTALVLDFMDPTFRTPDQLAGYLGTPVLAALPRGGE